MNLMFLTSSLPDFSSVVTAAMKDLPTMATTMITAVMPLAIGAMLAWKMGPVALKMVKSIISSIF